MPSREMRDLPPNDSSDETPTPSERPDLNIWPKQPQEVLRRDFFPSAHRMARGVLLIVAALTVAAMLIAYRIRFNVNEPVELIALSAILAGVLLLAAIGVERIFDSPPTLSATPEGLMLRPGASDRLLPWHRIRAVRVHSFGNGMFGARVLAIDPVDPDDLVDHLPAHMWLAYRIDRRLTGLTLFYRPRSAFAEPLDDVAATLDAIRRGA